MQDTYAYCRIMAGDEESLNRLNVIRDMQVLEENIFLDYPTKEKRSRIQYNKLIKQLREIIIDAARGDVYDMFELIQQNKMIALSSF